MAPLITIPVFLIYLAITANLEWRNLVLGLVIALGATVLARPRRRPIRWRRLPAAFLATLRYLTLLGLDLIKGGYQTARIVLDPKLPLLPGVVAIPSGCESELATALSAHAITLAPGEMVVEIDQNGFMYTHMLDVSHAADYVAEAQQMRRELLRKIFE